MAGTVYIDSKAAAKARRKAIRRSKNRAKKAKALEEKLATGNNWGKSFIVEGVHVASKEFLQTYAWSELRWKVLNHYGRRCMCCGATPEMGAVMNVDHIKSRREFPELALSFDNLQVLCGICNKGKGNSAPVDLRPDKFDAEQIAHLRSILKTD